MRWGSTNRNSASCAPTPAELPSSPEVFELGRRIDADVLIAGGGPAGASSALRLSQYGHEVLLLDKGPKGDVKRQHVGESLPSSIRVVLTTLGLERPPELVVRRRPAHLAYWGEMQGGRPWA